jgi:hypothetical protein
MGVVDKYSYWEDVVEYDLGTAEAMSRAHACKFRQIFTCCFYVSTSGQENNQRVICLF